MNPDDAGRAERVWFRMARLHTRLGGEMSDRLRMIGLSVPQYDVLATLTEREGVSQQELAERLYVTKGNISGLIDRLAAAGLVERRATEGDRRSHAIFLTKAGEGLASGGLEIQRQFIAQTIGMLPSGELASLEAVIVHLRDIARKAAGVVQESETKPA